MREGGYFLKGLESLSRNKGNYYSPKFSDYKKIGKLSGHYSHIEINMIIILIKNN